MTHHDLSGSKYHFTGAINIVQTRVKTARKMGSPRDMHETSRSVPMGRGFSAQVSSQAEKCLDSSKIWTISSAASCKRNPHAASARQEFTAQVTYVCGAVDWPARQTCGARLGSTAGVKHLRVPQAAKVASDKGRQRLVSHRVRSDTRRVLASLS